MAFVKKFTVWAQYKLSIIFVFRQPLGVPQQEDRASITYE